MTELEELRKFRNDVLTGMLGGITLFSCGATEGMVSGNKVEIKIKTLKENSVELEILYKETERQTIFLGIDDTMEINMPSASIT